MRTLIKNGRLINPITKTDEVLDLLIENQHVVELSKNISGENIENIIDATDKIVAPGFIDLHVHLREPGFEYKETIETGCKSAAKGGFTSICPMPNTKPTTDSGEVVRYVLDKAKNEGIVNVLPIGAITLGQLGQELVDVKSLKEAGAVGISEDGRSVLNAAVLREAMKIAKEIDMPVMSHCEDDSLAEGGCMNEGAVSKKLGLKGIPNLAEDVITARDILISKELGTKLHLCHVSTKESVSLIRQAKVDGAKVTMEVCPHHFTLTDEAVKGDNPETKMNPPLRTAEDLDAIKEAFKDGTVDAIATDHAPHHPDEKTGDYQKAANGIVGFETALALSVTELVEKGYLTMTRLVEVMSTNPAKILGIDKGNIEVGKIADIVVFDDKEEYTIEINDFVSKSNNSPFGGMKVRGKVLYTLVDGKVVYQA